MTSTKWRIELCNYNNSKINFKVQLYSTDVTLLTDSIDQTDGKCFTCNTDLNCNKVFQISNIHNVNDKDIVDNNVYDDSFLNIINSNESINIDYTFENEVSTGSMKCTFKLVENCTIPNIIKLYYLDGNDYVLYQTCNIDSLKSETNQGNINKYIVFECISTNEDLKWVLTKYKMFTV